MPFTLFGKTYGTQKNRASDSVLNTSGMRKERIPYSTSVGELENVGIRLGERCTDDPRYREAYFPDHIKLTESSFGQKILRNHQSDRSCGQGTAKDIIDSNGNVLATCFDCVAHGQRATWIELHYNHEHDLRKSHSEIWS